MSQACSIRDRRDGSFDGIHGCFTIGLRIDVDPHLPRIDVRRACTVTKHGPSEIGESVLHSRDLPQVADQFSVDRSLLQRGAGRTCHSITRSVSLKLGTISRSERAPEREARDRRHDAGADAGERRVMTRRQSNRGLANPLMIQPPVGVSGALARSTAPGRGHDHEQRRRSQRNRLTD